MLHLFAFLLICDENGLFFIVFPLCFDDYAEKTVEVGRLQSEFCTFDQRS
jgi:hypothetical protein